MRFTIVHPTLYIYIYIFKFFSTSTRLKPQSVNLTISWCCSTCCTDARWLDEFGLGTVRQHRDQCGQFLSQLVESWRVSFDQKYLRSARGMWCPVFGLVQVPWICTMGFSIDGHRMPSQKTSMIRSCAFWDLQTEVQQWSPWNMCLSGLNRHLHQVHRRAPSRRSTSTFFWGP